MNFIKSVFIFLAPIALLAIVIHSVFNMIDSKDVYVNIGLLMSSLPLLLFLSQLLIFKNVARTNPHLPWVSVPSFLGYCLVLFVFLKTSNIHLINAMVFSLCAFFITFLYIYWYSNNRRKTANLIANNKQLPQFTVKDTSNNEVSSLQFIGQQTLIFFYRGNWCPLCMAQIEEIVALYKKFEENNIDVVFISPQSSQHTEKLAKKFNLSFKFFIDEENHAAKQLGIDHKFGLPMGFQTLGYESDTVHPTVIAINKAGNIIYNDQTTNYRVRPEPEELLAIFNEK